jgi:pimeloyl-ACP methyl ester carboxylesterase
MKKQLGRCALYAGLALGVPAAINAIIQMQRRVPLAPLDGDARDYAWSWGRVRYYVKGDGPPLLLLHGVYAGASAYEWRHNFDELSQSYRVYAPDLLGFGLSDKPNAPYTANLYVRLVEDFMREVVGEPTMICASSLSSAFAIAAQPITPMARKLALVCPTGIVRLNDPNAIAGKVTNAVLKAPVYGKGLYNCITSKAGIRHYLRDNVYADPSFVTDASVEYHHAVAHQPGARHAVRAFISGRLNADVGYAFSRLEIPVMLLWGRRARVTPLPDADEFIGRNPRADLHVFDHSGLLPHQEEASAFNEVLSEFLSLEPMSFRLVGEE